MSANFYWHEEKCQHCGRKSMGIHVGKLSIGWVFLLHVADPRGMAVAYDEVELPRSLEGWRALFERPGSAITDEYGGEVSAAELLHLITARTRPAERKVGKRVEPNPPPTQTWYAENDAEPGPNGLAQPRHCVGRAPDGAPYSLMSGEFR